MNNKITVEELVEKIESSIEVNSSVHGRWQYLVVAVMNSGDGPDEKLIDIDGITWDHELKVMRLELTP